MKRDLKLNMSNLRAILAKVNAYKEELEQIETASAKFLEVIKEQDSKAYDKLSRLWEENVTQNESDLKEKLAIISELLNNYIVDMESYITPKDSGTMVRVDRNDIWWNYKQIAQRISYAAEFEEIQSDVFSSLADYKKCFVYNPFEDEGANSARKTAQQAEEEAERKRREYNYEQLEGFREVLRGKLEGSLKQSVEKIHRMYEDAIVPFENTDDEYKKKLGSYYNEWASVGDKFADGWHVVKNAGLGAWDGLTDLVLGILKLLKGVSEVVLWLALQNPVTSYFGIMPEFLEEDMGELWTGIKQLLKDPGNIVEAIGQSTFDTVDEKGAAYSVSYVTTDVVAGVLLDKGLGKLGALGKADDVAGDVAKYTDEVAEAASKAGKQADDVAEATKAAVGKAVSESGRNFKGKLYNGIRNPDVDFVNGKGKSKLNIHAGKHGYTSPEEYLKDARNFLEKKPTSTIQSFVSNEGTYFRYDTATNEFGIINEYGGISTYFKPENGMAYWLEQIEKYAQK